MSVPMSQISLSPFDRRAWMMLTAPGAPMAVRRTLSEISVSLH